MITFLLSLCAPHQLMDQCLINCMDQDSSTCQPSQWGVIKDQAYSPGQMEFGLRIHF